jgi:hypothetical protein
VSPNTTDQKIIEFKDFILSKNEQEITLNNGKTINVPIEETMFPPIVNPEFPEKSGKSEPSSIEHDEDQGFIIKLNRDFCNNPISEMNSGYSIKNIANFFTLFALTQVDENVFVPAFLITITIKTDIPKTDPVPSLWVDALCSDQSKEYIGGSNLLRLVLELCKMFNEKERRGFTFVNSYLEALRGVEETYIKQGYEPTSDFSSKPRTTAFKRKIVLKRDRDDSSTVKNKKDRNELSPKGGKSRRKTIRKRKPRKSRKPRKYGAK